MHWHRSVVVLPDGVKVVAASYHSDDPYGRDQQPEYGLYLDYRWQPPWPDEHVNWPDFSVPADVGEFGKSLRAVLDRPRAGMLVEIGCLGGHGRTGTALACLAVLGPRVGNP